MKRYARIVAAVGLFFLLSLVAGAVALRFMLPPEKARQLLTRQIETRLGREVKLGSLGLSGISTLRVDGVEISETPSFEAGTFLTAETFKVSARLLPLLFRKLVVKDILLVRPKVTIVRLADGRFNVAPSSGSAVSAGSPPATARRSDLLISDLRLENGSIVFIDKSTAAMSAVLDPINVHLAHVSLTSPVSMSGSATAKFRDVLASLRFAAGFDPLKGEATLTRFLIESSSATVNVTGQVQNIFSAGPGFNGALTWKGLDPAVFASVIPIPEGLTVSGPTTGRLDVSGTAPSVESHFEADMTHAGMRWKSLIDKEPGIPFTAEMALDRNAAGELQLHDLVVRLASLEIRGDGTLKGSSETARVASFRVETNEFDVADLFRHVHAALPTELKLSGPVRAGVSMEGWTGGGRFVADFDGTKLDAAYGNAFQKAPGVRLRLVADGRYATPLAVDFSSLRLDLDALSMSGRGSYTTGKVRPTYVFRVKTNVFPLTAVGTLMPVARPYSPSGQAVVNIRISRGTEGPLMGGNATLMSAGGTIQTASINELAGSVDFGQDWVKTEKLTGRIQGQPVQMSLKANRLATRPMIEADIRAEQLDIGRLLPPTPKKTEAPSRFRWSPFAVDTAHAAEPESPFLFDTKGSLRSNSVVHPDFSGENLSLEWNLRSVTATMDQIQGTAKLRHGKGEAKNIRSMVEGSKAARLLLAPLNVLQKIDSATGGAFRIPALENLPFHSISGDYSMTNGVATIAPMAIVATGFSSRMDGTVALSGAQALQLSAVLTANSDQVKGVIGDALGLIGKVITVRMTISGTLAEPKVSIDKESLRKKADDVIRGIGQEFFKNLTH